MDRIAFALNSYLGPSKVFIYETLRNIKSFEVMVLTQKTGNLEQFPHPYIFSTSDLPLHQRLSENLTNYFGRFAYFKKIIKEYPIKLIHAQFAWDGIYMLPLKRYLKLPLVTTFRGLDIYGYSSNPIYRNQLKRLFAEGDLFLPVSKKLAERAISLGCPENKIIVLYGGIDLDKFKYIASRPKDKNKINILMCGRFVEKKGFAYGIKAFAQSLNRHKNISLRIIGSGPLKRNLIKLVKNLGIERFVTFEGDKNHQEVAKALQEADIFMMSYVTARDGSQEGIPNVLKEAQATGLPTLSTHHAGVPEVVLDGETGFLAEEKDVESLSQKLNLLIGNQKLRADFGKRGRKWAEERFDVVTQTRKLEDNYKKLISP